MRNRRKRRCCDRESECCCCFGEAERPGRGTWRSIRWICGISARWTWCSRRTARIRVEKSEACEVDSLMQQSVYSMIETLVPRGEDGGLKNRNEYLQVFGKGTNGRPHWVVILEEPCFVCSTNTRIQMGRWSLHLWLHGDGLGMRRNGFDRRDDDEVGVSDLLLVEKIQIDVIHLRHEEIRLLLHQGTRLDDRLGGLCQRFSSDSFIQRTRYWSYNAFFDFGIRPKMIMWSFRYCAFSSFSALLFSKMACKWLSIFSNRSYPSINTNNQNLIPLQHLEVFLTKLLLHLRFGSFAVVPDGLMLAKTFD